MKKNIKLGIYGIALLMMGVIGIASSLGVIGANFPDISQTMIQSAISIPSAVIIPVTIIVGKLMQTMSKKKIALAGILLFVIGGIVPAYLTSFSLILVFRGILGAGVGVCQVVSTALVVDHFEGPERDKTQGMLQACQMAGCAIMTFGAGYLAEMTWNATFYVHLLGVLAFFLVLFCIPSESKKVGTQETTAMKHKVKITKASWGFIILMFFTFIVGQINNVGLAFLVVEKQIGTAADAGMALSFLAFGGIAGGLFYGKLAKYIKNYTVALGMLMTVIAFLLMASSKNMVTCYVADGIYGFALSLVLPGIFMSSAQSSDIYSASFIVACVTCAQNLAQFVEPYILNPVFNAISAEIPNTVSYYFAACLAVLLLVATLIWAKKSSASQDKAVSA